MTRPPRKLAASALWEYALKAVGQRAQSSGELRTKLRNRAANASDVDATIAKLKEYGMLDDRRFAESFATARLENQGFGKARALHDLRQRRVAPAVAEKAVQQIYEGRDEIKLIEEFLRRKLRGKDLAEEKDLASAFRRLRAAGFSPGNSLGVLKRMAKNPEMVDDFNMPESE